MPLVESILIVQNLPFLAALQERGKQLGVEAARFRERTHYPLAVTVVPGAELTIKIGFDTHRFDPDTIERMLGHLRTILEAIAVDAERRLVDVPLMTESEQEQMLGMGNHSPNVPHLDDLDLDRLDEVELDVLLDQLG
jgi:non-ribosomal peptide synthetase component F